MLFPEVNGWILDSGFWILVPSIANIQCLAASSQPLATSITLFYPDKCGSITKFLAHGVLKVLDTFHF